MENPNIHEIRRHRELHGGGLKEAKRHVERMQAAAHNAATELPRRGFLERTPAGDAWRRSMGRLLGTAMLLGLAGYLFYLCFLIGPPSLGAIREGGESRSWPSAEGVVTRSEFRADTTWSSGRHGQSRNIRRYWAIRYDYSVGVQRYSARRVKIGKDMESIFGEKAQAVVDRYPVGARVTVRYRPGSPEVATLQAGVDDNAFLALGFAALFFSCGVWILYVLRPGGPIN
ncbi:MAG TPA: DUF3592 domain-containing protein [Longimicrobiaceae bacterium]|nr:DUF3592 domain-containing protein [Longimicrobiaceae bacterium]